MHVDRFLDQYERQQQGYLNIDLQTVTSGDAVSANMFTRLFLNLLRIQGAINTLYTDHLQQDEDPMAQRMVVNLFIIHYFTADPTAHFWSLDETLARWAYRYCAPVADYTPAADIFTNK